MGIKIKKKGKVKYEWNDSYYVRAYELARTGLDDTRIARSLGIPISTMTRWKEQNPKFKEALARARGGAKASTVATRIGHTESFIEYVYNRLSPKLQALWDQIAELDKEKGGVAKIEALLAGQGVRVRQYLFFHALVTFNFNYSEALRMTNSTRIMLDEWSLDPRFQQLVDEFIWHKKNFFEGALVGLVRQGDSAATIFVNKTFNRDRGYNDKMELDVKTTNNNQVSIDQLDLPIEVRVALMEAMRKAKGEPRQALPVHVETSKGE